MQDFSAAFYKNPYCRAMDSHLTHFERARDGRTLLLYFQDSCFYPEGGGQPGDTGTLRFASPNALNGDEQAVSVLDCRYVGGRAAHIIAYDPTVETSLQRGMTVHLELNWERRFDLMQQHSCEHILSGLAHQRFGYDNVGFGIHREDMNIDLNGPLSAEQVRELELDVNRVICRNLPIQEQIYEADCALSVDFRSKKAIDGALRLIEIEDVDRCACCGTQLRWTGEIGLFKIMDFYPHRGGTRLIAAAGLRAFRVLQAEQDVLRQCAAELSVKKLQTHEGIVRQANLLNQLKRQLSTTRRLLFEELAKAQVNSYVRNADQAGAPGDGIALDAGAPSVLEVPAYVRPVRGADGDILKDYCKELASRVPGLHLALDTSGDGVCRFAACIQASDADDLSPANRDTNSSNKNTCRLKAVTDQAAELLRTAFDLRGGGRDGFIQGTIQADDNLILSFLEHNGFRLLSTVDFSISP